MYINPWQYYRQTWAKSWAAQQKLLLLINKGIHWLGHPSPHLPLRCCQRLSNESCTGLVRSKSWRITLFVQKLRKFWEMGQFCPMIELYRIGSAYNGATPPKGPNWPQTRLLNNVLSSFLYVSKIKISWSFSHFCWESTEKRLIDWVLISKILILSKNDSYVHFLSFATLFSCVDQVGTIFFQLQWRDMFGR